MNEDRYSDKKAYGMRSSIEEEINYRCHSLQIVETTAQRWRVFENSAFVCESWSRDRAIDRACEIVDKRIEKRIAQDRLNEGFALSSDAPKQAEQVDRVISEVKLRGVKHSI